MKSATLHRTPPSPVPALGTVLCAVDSSDSAAAVLYAAAGLAAHPDSRLIVVRVDGETTKARVDLIELVQQSIPGWLAYREQTDIVTSTGRPDRVILRLAEERGVNLIVMGTHSRRALSRVLFGSVAASVLAKATVPVAIVPPSGPELISLTDGSVVPHLGSILVAVDLRGASARQLALSSVLSLASERELVLLHVIPPRADSAEPLRRLREMAGSVDSRCGAVAVVTHGPVVNVILDRQKRASAGVVILGRDAGSPGKIACELLEKTRAVVVFVP